MKRVAMTEDVALAQASMKKDVEVSGDLGPQAKALALILIDENFDQLTWGRSRTSAMLRAIVAVIRKVDTTDDLSYEDAARQVLRGYDPFGLEMLREGLWAVKDRAEKGLHVGELASRHAREARADYLASYVAQFIKDEMNWDEFDTEADALRDELRSARA